MPHLPVCCCHECNSQSTKQITLLASLHNNTHCLFPWCYSWHQFSPLQLAIRYDHHFQVVRHLWSIPSVRDDFTAANDALCLAADLGRADCIQLMLSQVNGKVCANLPDEDQGCFPLMWAAKSCGSSEKHLESVRVLLAHGALCTARARWTMDGVSALHCACMRPDGDFNRSKVVELLLSFPQGMSPDSQTRRGETPLHLAAQHGLYYVSQTLIRFNANVHVRLNGNTPTQIARISGHSNITELLLMHGGDFGDEEEEHDGHGQACCCS